MACRESRRGDTAGVPPVSWVTAASATVAGRRIEEAGAQTATFAVPGGGLSAANGLWARTMVKAAAGLSSMSGFQSRTMTISPSRGTSWSSLTVKGRRRSGMAR